MKEELNKCTLCPRKCSVNRNEGQLGYCNANNKIKIAKAYLHLWEEPCISGDTGSGTIFFSSCNLRCLFCQNYYISEMNNGVEIDINRFSEICVDLQNQGAKNINLVTPTHYVPLIIDGIKLAKKNGLTIPIIYNSSGYENVDTLKMLEETVDVYLPDFKYYNDEVAIKYSKCPNYLENVKLAIDEMVRQKPKCIFNDDGMITSGVIVRHMLMPLMEEDSKKILNYLYEKYGDNIYISIMNQYTPVRKCRYDELNKKVDSFVYESVIDYAWDIGIRNAFIQEDGTQNESFIPEFDFKG